MKIRTDLYNPDIKQKYEMNVSEVFQLTINNLIDSYKTTGEFSNKNDLKLTIEEFVFTNFRDNLPEEFTDDDNRYKLIENLIFGLLTY